MQYSTYVQMNLFAVAFLLVLYFNSRISAPHLLASRRFRVIVLLTVSVLLLDSASWSLDGQMFDGARPLIWGVNILYFIFSGVIAFAWLCYALFILKPAARRTPLQWLLAGMPLLWLTVMSFTAPWTGRLFTVNAENIYQRGPLFFVQTVISLGYLLAAGILALFQYKKEMLRERRWECLWVGGFAVLPLIGGIIQLIFYRLILLWPSTALSLMLVYINLQNQQISLDALTGLNNRGQFDKYLHNRCAGLDEETALFLLLLDIDQFKQINDRNGHVVGDEALVQAAGILRQAFSGEGAFLARYGGDEFAVIFTRKSGMGIDDALDALRREVDDFNARADHPLYSLQFSMGYARCDAKKGGDPVGLIAQADKQMYLQKGRHREEYHILR